MTLNKPFARMRALRALAEGAKPTLDLLADAGGRSLNMLRRTAEREGWALHRVPQEDVMERIRGIGSLLLDQAEAVGREAAEQGGKIDKAKIDGLIALARSIDKIGEIMRPDEVAKENQIKQDEDLAAVLQRINDRIIELARELAGQMVAEQCGSGRSVAAKKRVVPEYPLQAVPAALARKGSG
jgi:hypothetical protein